MSPWQISEVGFRLAFSDKVIAEPRLRLYMRPPGGVDQPATAEPQPPDIELPSDCLGYLIRGVPAAAGMARLARVGGYLRYVPHVVPRYFLRLDGTFDHYLEQFSGKTRSTLRRKVRRFAHDGGDVEWRAYRSPEEVAEFHRLASGIASETYQERLFGGGLPAGPDFLAQMQVLARDSAVRAYIVFREGEPCAYLYLVVSERRAIYSYLGYRPQDRQHSPGTVLHWFAIGDLFDDPEIDVLDFTEGAGEQKQRFATGEMLVANVYFLRPGFRTLAVVYGQIAVDRLSAAIGSALDRLGLKARIRQIMRFGVGRR